MRPHDIGGAEACGPVDTEDDGQPFHADWEARVYALSIALGRKRIYTTDEFRDAIERMPEAEYHATSYYERWLAAMRSLVVAKGCVPESALSDD